MDESPRIVVLVILLLFIFFAPDQTSIQRFGRINDESIDDLRHVDFNVTANSTFGELEREGLNLTGFASGDNHQWQLLPDVKQLVRRQQAQDEGRNDVAFYQRITADIRGKFIRKDIGIDHGRQLNLSALDPMGGYVIDEFQRNVTEPDGELYIAIQDSKGKAEAREIKASFAIHTDSAPGTGWEGNLRGVHFANGNIILTTNSRKFNALPALPQFALDERGFALSKAVMNNTVRELWERAVFNDNPFLTIPSCEIIIWLHQRPLRGTAKYIEQIERELHEPDGAPIGTPEPIAFSAVVFSPDCGYVLEADTVFGPKLEVYWNLVRRLLIAFVAILALEIALLKRQMEKCATPSTRARISYYSIGIAAFGDGLILFSMIGLLMLDGDAFSLLAAVAFLCSMHVAFFEVKFIFDIWTVQVGEPAQAQRDRERRTANTAPAEGLPLPATARTEGTVLPGQLNQIAETPRTTFASLYFRFYFALVNLEFFSLWAMTWSQNLRSVYINILSFCYFSLWIPQIYRNVMRNCRKALTWEYTIGTSILRAVPVLYWYFDGKNVLAAKASPRTALMLIAWLCIQLLVLVSQQYLGPRLLVKDTWCPPAYDYHPILSEDIESKGMPIGEVASASEGKDKDDKTRKVFDCAICMNEIDVPVVSRDQSSGRSWLEQRNYMVTPCRHIFHTDCLEGWMNLRLVCPVCREGLPPL